MTRVWSKGIPGVYGNGLNGPPDTDLRANWDEIVQDERPRYCNHTGHDYWPRPCDACLRRSERELHKVTS